MRIRQYGFLYSGYMQRPDEAGVASAIHLVEEIQCLLLQRRKTAFFHLCNKIYTLSICAAFGAFEYYFLLI